MAEAPDSQMALMFSLYEGLIRKGPGSEASTRKALSMLDTLPPATRIVDFGCGAGAASLVLARNTRCSITAVDIHQPFLDELEVLAARERSIDRIKTIRADMANPPFPDGSLDVVWSEGAIYIVGFEQGLRRWRRLLRPGGLIAVTEVTWLSDAPSRKAVEFWATEYPAMAGVEGNLTKVRAAGFDPIGHFALPSEAWENYYRPLEERLSAFRAEHSGNPEAQTLLDSTRQEIDIWRECGSSYGYVFYVGKAI